MLLGLKEYNNQNIWTLIEWKMKQPQIAFGGQFEKLTYETHSGWYYGVTVGILSLTMVLYLWKWFVFTLGAIEYNLLKIKYHNAWNCRERDKANLSP